MLSRTTAIQVPAHELACKLECQDEFNNFCIDSFFLIRSFKVSHTEQIKFVQQINPSTIEHWWDVSEWDVLVAVRKLKNSENCYIYVLSSNTLNSLYRTYKCQLAYC